MWTLVEDGLKQMFKNNHQINAQIPAVSGQVAKGEISPTAAARKLLSYL
jgi:hypothetical protein